MHSNKPVSRSRRAATLVEVLIASSLSLLVVGAGLSILITGIRSSLNSTSLATNDISQWGIESRLLVDSKIANGITIFSDFTTAAINAGRRSVDERGNMLVLSKSIPSGTTTSYTQLTGYVYDTTSSTIFRFNYTVPTADQTSNKSLENILKDNMTAIRSAYVSVTSNATPLVASGAFLCRAYGTAATLSCSVRSGVVSNRTSQSKLIEATFFIRA